MEAIYRAAALAVSAAVLSLLLKKRNPELSLLLGAMAAVGILGASLRLLGEVRELRDQVASILGSSDTLTVPVLKCLAIALVTKISVDLCRDASQTATASALEFAGTICAMSTVMPLLISVLKMLGGMM